MNDKQEPTRVFGWKPDIPDHRDFRYTVSRKKAKALPSSVNLRRFCNQVEDQLHYGSCVAHASTSCMEFLTNKNAGKPKMSPQLSRFFVYYATRVWVEGVSAEDDAGCYNRDAVKALTRYGVCKESLWPYDLSGSQPYAKEPDQPARDDALTRTITSYYRCDDLQAILACLAEGYPLLGGFAVPANMNSEYCARTGRVAFPAPTERILGGHAVMFVGYSMKSKLLTYQNSWSSGWGRKGYGYLPFSFVEHELATDFWTIRAGEGL